jgi:hypothetical protein
MVIRGPKVENIDYPSRGMNIDGLVKYLDGRSLFPLFS